MPPFNTRYQRVGDPHNEPDSDEDTNLLTHPDLPSVSQSSSSSQQGGTSTPSSLANKVWHSVRYALGQEWSDPIPLSDAQEFKSSISKFGTTPDLELLSYEEALSKCARERKVLLVYLQSNMHTDTETFLKEVFCTEKLAETLRTHGILCWAGSVQSNNGFTASSTFQVYGFPFLGLYCSADRGASFGDNTSPSYRQLWVNEGMISVDDLCRTLVDLAEAQAAEDAVTIAEELERSEERRMRNDQERSFQEAMMRDLELEQERIRAENEARAREAAALTEENARLEQSELAAAIELSKESDKESLIVSARQRLAANPEPTPADHLPRDIGTLKFTLPNGIRVERNFLANNKLSLVRDFLLVASSDLKEELGSFDLAMNIPKVTFNTHDDSSPDLDLTIKDAKMFPRAMVFVKVFK